MKQENKNKNNFRSIQARFSEYFVEYPSTSKILEVPIAAAPLRSPAAPLAWHAGQLVQTIYVLLELPS